MTVSDTLDCPRFAAPSAPVSRPRGSRRRFRNAGLSTVRGSVGPASNSVRGGATTCRPLRSMPPVMRPIEWRSSFDHFGLGAPLTYQLEPLSARIIPYVFSAWRMTRVCREARDVDARLQPHAQAHRRQRRDRAEATRSAAPDRRRPARARGREPQRVVDAAARDLVIACEARARSAGRPRPPTSSPAGRSAFERQVPHRARAGVPARRRPGRREQLVELAGVAVDEQRVPVAVGCRPALDRHVRGNRVRSLVALVGIVEATRGSGRRLPTTTSNGIPIGPPSQRPEPKSA